MTRIYLVRHAEAEGNLYRIAHGHYNGLITARGYKQIAALQQRFEHIHIDAVYSSDLFRTRTTARAVYLPKGLPLHTDPNLREVNMGVWEGHTWQQLRMEDEERMVDFNRHSAMGRRCGWCWVLWRAGPSASWAARPMGTTRLSLWWSMTRMALPCCTGMTTTI